MSYYRTKGIVLKTETYRENDKAVTLFTLDRGKLKLIAKGGKKTTSPFLGKISIFSLLETLIANGKNIDILTQAEILHSFENIRQDFIKFKIGAYFIKIVDKATSFGQKNKELFNLLFISLKKLEDGTNIEALEKFFDLNFLNIEGIFKKNVPVKFLISEHIGEDVSTWEIV